MNLAGKYWSFNIVIHSVVEQMIYENEIPVPAGIISNYNYIATDRNGRVIAYTHLPRYADGVWLSAGFWQHFATLNQPRQDVENSLMEIVKP